MAEYKTVEMDMDNDGSKIFFTSDLHLNHRKIIEYAKRNYEMTPEGISDMNEDILAAFDALPDNCVVWNLGDVFLGRNDFSLRKKMIERMKNGNRKLCLILGNHDVNADLSKTGHASYEEYFKALGFDEVYTGPVLFKNMIFSHFPEFLSEDSTMINVHGHTHQNKVFEKYFDNEKAGFKGKVNPDKYINICMDCPDFNETGSIFVTLKNLVEMCNSKLV